MGRRAASCRSIASCLLRLCLLMFMIFVPNLGDTSPGKYSDLTSENSDSRGLSDATKDETEKEEEVSACLHLRDDNHLLPEWLAYHYHSLPLRHLVVFNDPASLTSPMEVLKRWTEDTGDVFEPMSLVVWDETVYNADGRDDADRSRDSFEGRKRWFMRKCAQFHKEMGRKWVIMTDANEFITLNGYEVDDPDYRPIKEPDSHVLSKLPGIFSKYFENGMKYTNSELEEHRPDLWILRELKLDNRKTRKSSSFPRDGGLASVMDPIPWVNNTCVVLPRLTFSPKQSHTDVLKKSNAVDFGFDPVSFRTLRYFHHDEKASGSWGKAIIDVNRTAYSDLFQLVEDVHSPFPECGFPVPKYDETIFRIHRYVGTWEEFSADGDCHGTRDAFDEISANTVGTNYDLQQWLGSFIDQVGVFRGRNLLKGAGDVPLVKTSPIGCVQTKATEQNF